MNTYQYDFHNIGIRCIDRFILVENKEALKKFLKEPGTGSMQLALEMKKMYQKEFGKEIQITQTSLAIEILGHVYAEKLAKIIKLLPFPTSFMASIRKAMDDIQKHTDVIDCGEKEVDSNRVVWDRLENHADLIFKMLGKNA